MYISKDLVSVIITTKNEEEMISRLIQSVKKQIYLNQEIIVVDNNSSDNTQKIAKKLGAQVYQFGPERSAQRNFGAKHARGKFFLFLDADMELSKEVVDDCVNQVKRDAKVGAVTILEQSLAKNFWEKVKAYERSFYNLEGDEITDAARFFKKEIFEKLGGYDETITGPEDWDLTDRVKRKGYKIAVCKSIIYHHERIPSLFSLLKKKFYYGLKSYRYLSKNQVPLLGPKTIYFLRPVFYKNYNELLAHPLLFMGMFFMLSLEMLAGGLGFLAGKIKRL